MKLYKFSKPTPGLFLLIGFSRLLFSATIAPNKSPGWFMGFSLNAEPKDIQARLDTVRGLVRYSKMEIPRFDGLKSAYLFMGKVDRAQLFGLQLDSSTIFLTAGRTARNSKGIYVGLLKMLKAEHFSTDRELIEKLFRRAKKEFSAETHREQRRKHRMGFADGKKAEVFDVTYLDTATDYDVVEIRKVFDPVTGGFSVYIEHTLADK